MIKPTPRNQDSDYLLPSKEGEYTLLFTEYDGKSLGAVFKNDILWHVITRTGGLPLGTLCLAKISELKTDIESAFLLVAGKQKCFTHLKELSPERNLSRPGAKPKCGDNFLVRIAKEPARGKLAYATTRLSSEELEAGADAASRTDFSIIRSGADYIDASINKLLDLGGINQGIAHNNAGGVFSDNAPDTDSDDLTQKRKLRIITDSKPVYDLLPSRIPPESGIELRFYEDSRVGLSVIYRLKSQIEEALSGHVWLKSGANLYIDRTEAMTVIDVNSSKSAGKRGESNHYLTVNKEAVPEIVHQIVLRNLSGIILIDFINMKSEDDRAELTEELSRISHQYDPDLRVAGLTRLGIMETTRKKTGPTLYERMFP